MVPDFHFMRHDAWANVLFLHWKVPLELQDKLQQHVHPFVLDRTPDGSVWIGLILLTEQNVGISLLPRVAPWNSFTHHGVNVRTYVKEEQEEHKEGSEKQVKRGIHFASLECDHRFVSHMARYFGMPYQLATMSRQYQTRQQSSGNNCQNSDGNRSNGFGSATTQNNDDMACANPSRLQKFRLVSQRSTNPNSLWHVLYAAFADKCSWHTTMLIADNALGTSPTASSGKAQSTNPKKCASTSNTSSPPSSGTFTVECEWERCSAPVSDPALASFFVERYFAYTYKYGQRLRGQVQHEPWPVETAHLLHLKIANIDAYQPRLLQPLLTYMAVHAPDSVLYSPGVGPIDFRMLQSV